MAVTSLVLGLISLVGMFCFGVLGVLLGLVAIVLGVLGLRSGHQRGLAIGGIVTGSIGLLIGLAFVAFLVLGTTAEINTDPADGVCDESRFLQDPDC